MNAIKNFIQDESGITAIEYALMAAGVALALTAAFTNLGAAIKAKLNAITTSLGGTAAS
jgi:pilus assembly protein Flp/PilA